MIISSTKQGRGTGPLPKSPKGTIIMATLNTTEVATEFGTDARTLRKFLRSPQGTDSTVGKGARWSIEKRDLRSLRKRFENWSAAQEARKVKEVAALDSADIPETDDEVETILDNA